MALIDMVMPRMGESIMECTVISWLKKPGDRIETDESVLEVATDKVDTEVPALHNGILKETLVNEGDVVAVGAPIARIEVDATVAEESKEPVPAQAPTVDQDEPAAAESEVHEVARELEASISSMSSHDSEKAVAASATSLTTDAPIYENRFYSPLVLNIAREEGIARAELDRIPGSGTGNRVTKKDILTYVQQRQEQPIQAPVTTEPTPAPAAQQPAPTKPEATPGSNGQVKPATSLNGQTDIIQMDRMRKMIAQRMVESKQISPHVSSFVEADMTPVVQWRTKIKDQFKQQTGENLTYTPLLIEAVVKAIRDFPMINISVDGDNIIVKRSINIGMAVALPSGNLIVPVIHDADQYNLIGLTKKVNDLSKRARENKLTADDLAGGTYTVSNIGTFGNVMGTPIILQPQVAIMAFGAIVKKPAVIETPQGDLIGIRQLMFLSHSYDHRVVDGSLGGQFVRRVADYLEQFDINRTL
ncbi:catalytic domain of components of various dehydrogenase complexes [Fibrisoma limi BUZ 3]|uniref:Dihydrolipoamide acetyltransferase component of pyruvate dehydrogenase complex n=1 Tax=Fibrisoma limi BUZ 3 TaxID=1185876 RepID=I2GDY7_9BACT|nr:dihydrolipoamide acetyltransferase family protein [Fibrisoma limi]CCH52112.1 catalytic domain of components of various dehydrogenase complexes [Fibrisoma limi BUZ 3]